MSYDLMVFEPEAAPRNHADFMEWYFHQTKWNEGHSYGDPAVTSSRLREWFSEIVKEFPCLNGVMSKQELPEDEASATDYSIGKQVIYAAFVWSKQAIAYEMVFRLAAKHKVGFFDVSSGIEQVWLPGDSQLVLAHQKSRTLIDKVRGLFTAS